MILMWTSLAWAADTRYVQASTLNLRASPSATAKVLGQVAIGSPLAVLASEGTFVRVRVGNGREGWVDATYLGPAPLTLADALARTRAAKTPAERLSWAQRAAAIAPDPTTLAELEAAYRAAGDTAAADRVTAERRWPRVIRPAASVERLEVEWAYAPLPGSTPQSGEVDVPLGELRARTGLDPATTDWWVLPDRGPAVKVRVESAAVSVWNECGGSSGLVLRFPSVLPEGAVPIAFTSSAPPASWSVDPAPPPIAREVATQAAATLAEARGWTSASTDAVALPDGWFVRIVQETAAAEGDPSSFAVVDLRVDAAGHRVVNDDTVTAYGFTDHPSSARDVNGDGAVEVVWRTMCRTSFTTPDGAALASGEDRCCGC